MNQPEPQTLGAKIRELRIAKGLTQEALAGGEMTPGLISQIESDRVAPSARVMAIISKQLGVLPKALIEEVEARSEQVQTIRIARERLQIGDGAGADALLTELQTASVLYLSSGELNLELAMAKELQGEFEQAEALYREVELAAFMTSDPALGVSCMQRQGDYMERKGRLNLAFYCYSQALRALRAVQSPAPATRIAVNRSLAICAYRLGDSQKALPFAQEAYQLLQTYPDLQELAEVTHLLSALLMETGQANKALDYASEAVSLYSELESPESLTDAQMNQAIVYRLLGDYASAMALWPRIIADYYEQKRSGRQATAWTERALCEGQLNRQEDAKRSLERSQTIADKGSRELAEVLRVRGDIALAEKRNEEALRNYEASLQALSAGQLEMESRPVLEKLARLYEKMGKAPEVREVRRKLALQDLAASCNQLTVAISVSALG